MISDGPCGALGFPEPCRSEDGIWAAVRWPSKRVWLELPSFRCTCQPPCCKLWPIHANSVWDVVKIRWCFLNTTDFATHFSQLRFPGEMWPHAETIFLVLAATLDGCDILWWLRGEEASKNDRLARFFRILVCVCGHVWMACCDSGLDLWCRLCHWNSGENRRHEMGILLRPFKFVWRFSGVAMDVRAHPEPLFVCRCGPRQKLGTRASQWQHPSVMSCFNSMPWPTWPTYISGAYFLQTSPNLKVNL